MEQNAARPGLGGAERRAALVRLARLYQLAGNLEGAARAWTDAAMAEAVGRDEAFLEGALAYIALGEYDRARGNLNAVLAGSRDGERLRRARYIAAQLDAFSMGNLGALSALLGENEYREYRPAIWYTLWRVSGDEAYRTGLLAEYPGSPEGRIASGAGAGQVSAVPSAMWLLFPGRESVVLGPPIPAASLPVINPGGPSLLPPLTTELSDLTVAPGTAAPGRGSLQAGLFSREDNAQALVRRLAAAGFSAHVSRREVKGAAYWAVLVPAGADANQTIRLLKTAGFESFPLGE
jgi:hypothetical protein